MDNPFVPMQNLQERLRVEAEALGLELHQIAFIPNPDPDGPNMVQAAFIIRPEAVEDEPEEVDAETLAMREQFEAILLGDKKSEEEERLEAMKEQTAKWLEGS